MRHPIARRAAAVIAFAGGVLGAATATSSPVTVELERDDGALRIAASATLRADAATAWRVLTAYAEYPRFIPGIRASSVVARQGRQVTVEQSDDALLRPLHWPLHIVYEITESPPDRLESRAMSRLLPTLRSRYSLTPTGDRVRLDYSGIVGAGLAGFGEIEQWALRRAITRQFQALADEIERDGDAALPRTPLR